MDKQRAVQGKTPDRTGRERRFYVLSTKQGRVYRLFPKQGGAITAVAGSDMPPVTEEDSRALLDALDEAQQAAERLIDTMERTHHLLQDSIREVREARHIAAWSNDCARTRQSRENKPV
jgi:hypothetical protein